MPSSDILFTLLECTLCGVKLENGLKAASMLQPGWLLGFGKLSLPCHCCGRFNGEHCLPIPFQALMTCKALYTTAYDQDISSALLRILLLSEAKGMVHSS